MAGPPGSPPGRLWALGTIVRRPGLRLAASLAVAATLVLVLVRFARFEGHSTPTAPLVADLAEAMASDRFVEPRLTGGFHHGRLVVLRSGDTPRGLDAYPPAVLSAVARIRERAGHDPSARALGALGITYLVSGDVAAAVKAFESATKQAPDDARLLSDLSAAYLVRASRLDEPADLPRALDAAEKSIELERAPEEAWFNRALALESLHLVDAARKAWEDYLERDATSGWPTRRADTSRSWMRRSSHLGRTTGLACAPPSARDPAPSRVSPGTHPRSCGSTSRPSCFPRGPRRIYRGVRMRWSSVSAHEPLAS